jgi:hypothetical protein
VRNASLLGLFAEGDQRAGPLSAAKLLLKI